MSVWKEVLLRKTGKCSLSSAEGQVLRQSLAVHLGWGGFSPPNMVARMHLLWFYSKM